LTIATGFSESIGIETVGSIRTLVMTDVIWRLALAVPALLVGLVRGVESEAVGDLDFWSCCCSRI
jgi:hypothetical protein